MKLPSLKLAIASFPQHPSKQPPNTPAVWYLRARPTPTTRPAPPPQHMLQMCSRPPRKGQECALPNSQQVNTHRHTPLTKTSSTPKPPPPPPRPPPPPLDSTPPCESARMPRHSSRKRLSLPTLHPLLAPAQRASPQAAQWVSHGACWPHLRPPLLLLPAPA